MNGDFVGRNSSGVATTLQSLGTNAIPWGSAYITSLILNGFAVDTSLLTAPKNRIVSGDTRSASNQPQFIDPNGAAASFILTGNTVNLVLDIDGVAVTVSTDITKSALTVGPSTTETCLVDESTAADQDATRTWGEFGSEKETITVDAMGAEFQTFIGQWIIIEITGVATEYAMAFVKSTTELTNIYRGFFTDSASAPVNRTEFTNNDVITALSTGWIFVENDGTTVDVSYTNPIRSFTAPSAPATGDYWYDLGNQTWKRYDGATFQIINRTLVGVVGIDAANCVAARSFDFFAKYENTNTIEIEIQTTSIVQTKYTDPKINVYGEEIHFGFNHETWNITADLAASTDLYDATEQASTVYYAYVKDTGDAVITDISPHYRPDLRGYYNPHNPWRCVGQFFNDSSSDIVMLDDVRFNPNISQRNVFLKDSQAAGTQGGTFTNGAYRTRVLNVVEDYSDMVVLASNQFRMMPGTYKILGRGQCRAVDQNKMRIRNIDTSLTPMVGGIGESGFNANTVEGTVTFDIATLLEMQHIAATTVATNGFGDGAAIGSDTEVNIFAQIELIKVA